MLFDVNKFDDIYNFYVLLEKYNWSKLEWCNDYDGWSYDKVSSGVYIKDDNNEVRLRCSFIEWGFGFFKIVEGDFEMILLLLL